MIRDQQLASLNAASRTGVLQMIQLKIKAGTALLPFSVQVGSYPELLSPQLRKMQCPLLSKAAKCTKYQVHHTANVLLSQILLEEAAQKTTFGPHQGCTVGSE